MNMKIGALARGPDVHPLSSKNSAVRASRGRPCDTDKSDVYSRCHSSQNAMCGCEGMPEHVCPPAVLSRITEANHSKGHTAQAKRLFGRVQ